MAGGATLSLLVPRFYSTQGPSLEELYGARAYLIQVCMCARGTHTPPAREERLASPRAARCADAVCRRQAALRVPRTPSQEGHSSAHLSVVMLLLLLPAGEPGPDGAARGRGALPGRELTASCRARQLLRREGRRADRHDGLDGQGEERKGAAGVRGDRVEGREAVLYESL
jgi:hypothetical protein